MKTSQWVINIVDEGRVTDISAITYGLKMFTRNLSADYYIPVSQASVKSLTQCHVKTIKDYIDVRIDGQNIDVKVLERPIIVLADKCFDDKISHCITLDEVQALFNCKLYYIGRFRQAKGLRGSIINRIKKSISGGR